MTVELKEGQKAAAGQCGSCEFFRRDETPEVRTIRGGPEFDVEIWRGNCGWKPPPWMEWPNNSRKVLDDDTCSSYRARDVEFIQSRRWRVS